VERIDNGHGWICKISGVAVNTTWRVLSLRMEEGLTVWRVAVNKLNKQPRTAERGGPLGGGGGVLTTPRRKNWFRYETGTLVWGMD
jgi:hypothetical protein